MTTNKPHDPELRAAIVAEMRRKKEVDRAVWKTIDDLAWFEQTWGYCTWWFKFEIPRETKEIRRELEKMERDGLVTADRSRRNNTLWKLLEVDSDNQ